MVGATPAPCAAHRAGRAIAALRGEGYRLLEAGRFGSAALRYLCAERLARRSGLPSPSWLPLAYAYRMLWEQTGRTRYLRRYLRYTREQVDHIQVRLLRDAARVYASRSQRT